MMGADEWRTLEDWPPPADAHRLFLHSGGNLDDTLPAADSPPCHYRYDPADPTPVLGGAVFLPPTGSVDQAPLEARPDVLCYTGAPLAADLDIIGPVTLELFARSSLDYTDFVGRLCDVHPDGRSFNVCDGLLRVTPGAGTPQADGSLRLEVALWPTAYRFRRGHRLRLQVASGAHPRWSRNLGTGDPLLTATRLVAADQTIYQDAAHPSALVLPVVRET
jgi:putative CocE/NonD family hydrolase